MANRRPNVAVIGMGGFAGEHHRVVQALEAEGECRLVCACDPRPDDFHAQRERWEFTRRGVAVHDDYRVMLDAHREELDMVTVPTPIPLHFPMHRACMEHSLACYLEKPPTLDVTELDAMIAADTCAPKRTQVGFHFIVEAARQALKRRLLDGEFGPVRRVAYIGYAPRSAAYYTRAPWAGLLMMDGRLVLDSPIGNAVSHYVHNLLFWAGQEEVFSWEGVASVQAEMYRAHAIEGMDTVFALGACANGIKIQVAASHACEGDQHSREWVECDQAVLSRVMGEAFRIDWKDGRQEVVLVEERDLLPDNFRFYFRYLQGVAARPLTGLDDTRPFVEFNDLAYLAAGRIATVPVEHLRRSQTPDGRSEWVAIHGLRDAFGAFFESGRFPSQQAIAWGRPGGQATREALPRLHATVRQMSEERA